MLARQTARVRSRRTLLLGLLRALGVTLVAALLAAPFAAAWGVGHAEVQDYLGPNRVRFATNFSGEVQLDLGPIGNAYLPSPAAPIGVTATVGGVGSAAQSLGSLFSEQTLSAYVDLYEDPQLALQGILDRLELDAAGQAALAEAVLLGAFALWRLRDRLVSPWVARYTTRRRTTAVYLAVLTLVLGSALSPRPPDGSRYPVSVARGSRYADVTVDSGALADLLDRGVVGVTLLSGRQQRAVRAFTDAAAVSLSGQLDRLPRARTGESLLLGFSDLHCNQAMTDLIGRLARVTAPRVVLDSGDDTVNGTAVEKTCIRREAAIYPEVPFVASSGNHDSNITEAQMRADGMVDLNGSIVTAAGLRILGDDDPEHNIPFSQDRDRDRPETEEQMATRLMGVAGARPVDVLLVHQPAASVVVMTAPNPPARLVAWGHFHLQAGPTVVLHDDGSWTVGMQEGTAGGVKQPTLTSFSTPFSPPLINADVYFYYRDDATGLITGVQPVHVTPDAKVVIDERIPTGDLAALPAETRLRLSGSSTTPAPAPTG
ncbi:metallophosphoesterase [uncultured Friedmanniella sp.]|uniref:metallophosphoesterase family protein n=1 Tax=uncultured Friedmanniella sp. TaxID=335381 RepID=UPI0035CAF815